MESQFLAAYNEYSDALFRYCLFKVSDREVAKDLVQEIFTKTWVYITDGHEIMNFKPFLYRILNNAIIDYYRKHKSSSLDKMSEDTGFDQAFDERLSDVDRLDGEQAIALLAKLPKDYRDVLYMRYVEDLDIKEIAEITGEVENTISVRIYRGINKLRELYPEEK